MYKKTSRFLQSLAQHGGIRTPQSAAHKNREKSGGRSKAGLALRLDESVKGRKVREWLAYLEACKAQGVPAFGVPEELRSHSRT
jgi:hypothetical protein